LAIISSIDNRRDELQQKQKQKQKQQYQQVWTIHSAVGWNHVIDGVAIHCVNVNTQKWIIH
jgi:hypothetical protein